MTENAEDLLEAYEDELAREAETNHYLSTTLKAVSQGEHSIATLDDINCILSITNTLIAEIDGKDITWSDEVDAIIVNLRNLLNKHHGPHTGGPGSWNSYMRNVKLIGDYIDHNALTDRASISHIRHIFGLEEKGDDDSKATVEDMLRAYQRTHGYVDDHTALKDYVDANS